jgi:hypothetical protein
MRTANGGRPLALASPDERYAGHWEDVRRSGAPGAAPGMLP